MRVYDQTISARASSTMSTVGLEPLAKLHDDSLVAQAGDYALHPLMVSRREQLDPGRACGQWRPVRVLDERSLRVLGP